MSDKLFGEEGTVFAMIEGELQVRGTVTRGILDALAESEWQILNGGAIRLYRLHDPPAQPFIEYDELNRELTLTQDAWRTFTVIHRCTGLNDWFLTIAGLMRRQYAMCKQAYSGRLRAQIAAIKALSSYADSYMESDETVAAFLDIDESQVPEVREGKVAFHLDLNGWDQLMSDLEQAGFPPGGSIARIFMAFKGYYV